MAVEMIVLNSREEWLQKRARTIGGSDAAAILGMNPYCSNVDLWEIKTGRRVPEDIGDKPYVQYGNQAERHLRGLFRLDFPEKRVEYIENNLWINSKYPWAHYSADGWLYDEKDRLGILEIKTTEIRQSSQWALWKNRIPDNYYIQILHGMMVMEAEFAVLKVQIKTWVDGLPEFRIKHYPFERADRLNDLQLVENSERNYAGYLKSNTPPALILPGI